jgi:hypothetical protein
LQQLLVYQPRGHDGLAILKRTTLVLHLGRAGSRYARGETDLVSAKNVTRESAQPYSRTTCPTRVHPST